MIRRADTFCLAVFPAAAGLVGAAAAEPAVDLQAGTFLATDLPDVRARTLTAEEDGDVLAHTIEGKGETVAEYFNGKTPYPTMSYPDPQPDMDPEVRTTTEIEAGLEQWWGDGDGDNPGEEERAEFDEVVGKLIRARLITAGVPNDPRAALEPVGDYQLLYPLTRIHPDLPVLPEVAGDQVSGVQGRDAKFYGNYANDSPVFADAPGHAAHAHAPQTLANPVDALGFPFMSLHGPLSPGGPMYQDFQSREIDFELRRERGD